MHIAQCLQVGSEIRFYITAKQIYRAVGGERTTQAEDVLSACHFPFACSAADYSILNKQKVLVRKVQEQR